jgi:putative phosphoribosyl transferase
MRIKEPLFKNRSEAGKLLVDKLGKYNLARAILLAIPRGGVPIGFEVAKVFKIPLDTLVVRKIGAPFNPEFGVAAIAPNDVIVYDNKSISSLGILREDLGPIIERERQEMNRRITRYRSGEFSHGAEVDTVIIVDDGLATGVTARAAIESVSRRGKLSKLVFASPICARDTAETLNDLVDVVCVESVDDLMAIGYWYEDFPQTSDEEVISLLERAHHEI